MANETEIKLQTQPENLDKLAQSDWFKARNGTQKQERLVSVYYDTKRRKLRRNGVSLRVRTKGNEFIQTVKTTDITAPAERGEWERAIDGDKPNLNAVDGTPLQPLVGKKLKRSLKPVFETRVERTTLPIDTPDGRIELALDVGEIKTAEAREAIVEIELELKSGDTKNLFETARTLSDLTEGKLSLESKADRGYALLDGGRAEIICAQPIMLDSKMSAADSFRAIGVACLHHFSANGSAVLRQDAQGVHQMRVGLRLLRAAMSIFGDLLGDEQSEAIKGELKWLTDELQEARDLDVFAKAEHKIKLEEGDVAEGRELFERAIEERRSRGFARAKAAVASPRYRKLTLNVLAWLAAGDWCRTSDPIKIFNREMPIEELAEQELSWRTKKISKRGAKLDRLDDERRHKFRIDAKKLRYAIEFFASLYGKRKQKKRRTAFRKSLRKLQDWLGALNDRAVHDRLTFELLTDERSIREAPVKQAFAAGAVRLKARETSPANLRVSMRAARNVAKARSFWS